MESIGPALAFLAGLLSTLSPCVLPLLPIVLGAAMSEHRLGSAALAAGLALSFVAVGLFTATVGFSLGLDGDVFRTAAAVMLAAFGLLLLAPRLQARMAVAAGPVSNWADRRLREVSATGPGGQFGVGLLLGAVWSPCVGPTLGAASVLAAQGRDLGRVALTMAAFGVGAVLPLVLVGGLSRRVVLGWRGRLATIGRGGMRVLGALLLANGVLILTGMDRPLESGLVSRMPVWLAELTTRF